MIALEVRWHQESESLRPTHSGQGQPEHVIGHAETGIPVEHHGRWEDSEQAEDQDPLAFSISASPLAGGADDRRNFRDGITQRRAVIERESSYRLEHFQFH